MPIKKSEVYAICTPEPIRLDQWLCLRFNRWQSWRRSQIRHTWFIEQKFMLPTTYLWLGNQLKIIQKKKYVSWLWLCSGARSLGFISKRTKLRYQFKQIRQFSRWFTSSEVHNKTKIAIPTLKKVLRFISVCFVLFNLVYPWHEFRA